MKIQYGIAGFVIGLMCGFLLGLIEMKITKALHIETATPFIFGATVIGTTLAGIITGVRRAGRL